MAIQKITAAVLGNNAVTAASVAAGTLSAADIADNSITAAKISASTSPTLGGLTVTGEITANGGIALGDNDQATFGDSDDLQIYHDGTYSHIKDNGTGNLYIAGDNEIIITDAAENEYKARFTTNGSVQLYYDNQEKLATTSTGIDVTGVIRSKADAALNDAQIGKFSFYNTNSNASANPERAYILGGRQNSAWGGYLSFYTSTGTDAATEAMRIQSDGALKLSERIILGSFTHGVTNSGAALIGKAGDRTGGTMTIQLGGSSASGTKWEIVDRAWTKVIAQISGEAPENSLVVNTSGYVGIGTGTPAGNLHIKSIGDVGDATLIIEADNDNNVETDNPRMELRQDGNLIAGYVYLEGDAGTTATDTLANSMVLDGKGTGISFATGGNAPAQAGGATNSTVRMTVAAAGNVGINQTSPSQKLEVVGKIVATEGITTFAGDPTNYGLFRSGTSMQLRGASTMQIESGSSADVVFYTNGGTERMRIDSAGRIRMPYQPAFCVANSPGTYPVAGNFGKSDNPTAGSSYTIHVNQGSHFSTSTGRFTAPISGAYYFSFSAMFDQNSSTSPGFDFKVNGSAAYGGEGLDSGTDSYMQLAGSILLTLSANDYVELHVRGSRIHQRYGSFEGFLLA